MTERPVVRRGEDDLARAREVAYGIRRSALAIAERQNGGYLGQACSSAEIFATLYVLLMKLGPAVSGPLTLDDEFGTERPLIWGGSVNGARAANSDRFVLSPAHYATPLYATLAVTGRMSPDALEAFGRDGSTLEMIGAEYSPGFETTSGSLAQAMSVAIGVAIARRRRADGGRVWALISDGELQEGQTWEALQTAPRFELDNLVVFLDANGYQVDGLIASAIGIDPIGPKVAAFGWSVAEVDGHNIEALVDAIDRWQPGRPLFVVCRTRPWQGIPSLCERPPSKLHFVRFREGEAEAARLDLSRSAERSA